MGFRSDETPIARARSHRTRLLASRRHAILLLLLRVPHEQTRVLIKRVLKLYPRTGSALEPFMATASHRWRAGHDQVWRWWRVRRQGLQLWLHVPKRARRLRSGCLSHPVCTSRRGRVVGRARSGCLGRRNPGRHSRRRRCRRRCRRCSAIRPSRRPSAASAERLLVLVAWRGRRRSVAQRRSHGWLMLSRGHHAAAVSSSVPTVAPCCISAPYSLRRGAESEVAASRVSTVGHRVIEAGRGRAVRIVHALKSGPGATDGLEPSSVSFC
jgi:hypothetical protein